ncbi:hypothetical protein [Demequina sp.]|uniref:hypothetical protein n=1 Tax=Demequina sp. TaxID=2050685 RepID=UPI0025F1B202|nr:hypothetical protein [Demequina sp.]
MRALAGAAVCALVLAGCSGASDLDGGTPTPAAVASAVPEVSASATGTPTASPDSTVTPEPVESSDAPSPLVTVTDENLIEAFDAAGFPCEGSLDGVTCAVAGADIPIGLPVDWAADTELRRDACEQGYINEDYRVVGDDATWFAAPDFEEQGQALIDGLAAAGYATAFFDYCPA